MVGRLDMYEDDDVVNLEVKVNFEVGGFLC